MDDETELQKQIREHPIVMFERAVKALKLRKREVKEILAECEGDHRTAVEYMLEKYGGVNLLTGPPAPEGAAPQISAKSAEYLGGDAEAHDDR